MMKIPFSPPDITEVEIQEVAAAMRSGWITTGPRTKKLEKRLAEFCHSAGAVCLNSATAALELNLRVLGIGPGDEVITSAYTYTASASPIVHVGATPILVDTAKDSYEMDYDALEAAITPRTKAVIPVDIAGIVCDYDRIFAIVESKKNIFSPNNDIQRAMGRVAVMAECAHVLGAQWHGQMAGSIADFSSFSFHAVKNFDVRIKIEQVKMRISHSPNRGIIETGGISPWQNILTSNLSWMQSSTTRNMRSLG